MAPPCPLLNAQLAAARRHQETHSESINVQTPNTPWLANCSHPAPQLFSPPAKQNSAHNTCLALHAWPAASGQAAPGGWPSQQAPAGPRLKCTRQRCCRLRCAAPRWWCTRPVGHPLQTAWVPGPAVGAAGSGAANGEPEARVACTGGQVAAGGGGAGA